MNEGTWFTQGMCIKNEGIIYREATFLKKSAAHASAATPPPMYPIAGCRLRPPCTLGAMSRKQTLMYVMNIAGSDIVQWFLPVVARYTAHAHSVVAANNWLVIPTYVQIIEKSTLQLTNATRNIGRQMMILFFTGFC